MVWTLFRFLLDYALASALFFALVRIVFLNQRTKAVGSGFAVILVIVGLSAAFQLRLMGHALVPMVVAAGVIAGLLFQEDLRFVLMQMTDTFRRLRDDVEVRQAFVRIAAPTKVLEGGSPPSVPQVGFWARVDNARRLTVRMFKDAAFTAKDQSQSSVLMNAIEQLSKLRLGALIVVDRNDDLSHHVSDGVALNAALSERLLHAIFIPESQNPLHDGACVVRGMTVVKAGCILPLSSNHEIPLSYGTRHRAGIGLSEFSRAVVIVVSEETGACTICHHGKWNSFDRDSHGVLPMARIKEYYSSLMKSGVRNEDREAGEPAKGVGIRRHLSFANALTGLGLVLLLYVTAVEWQLRSFVGGDRTALIVMEVDYNLGDDHVLMTRAEPVKVEVRGPAWRIWLLNQRYERDPLSLGKLVPCYGTPPEENGFSDMDCSEKPVGTYDDVVLAARTPDFLTARGLEATIVSSTEPRGIRATGPRGIRASIDILQEEEIPVLARFEGEVHPDWVQGNTVLTPARVHVRKPSRSRVDVLYTEPIVLDDRRDSIERNVRVVAPANVEHFQFVHPTQSVVSDDAVNPAEGKVRVSVPITFREEHSLLPPRVIQVTGTPAGYNYEIVRPYISVLVQGPRDRIASLNEREVQVEIDLEEEGTLSAEVQKDLAAGKVRVEAFVTTDDLMTWVSGLPKDFKATQLSPSGFTIILTREDPEP